MKRLKAILCLIGAHSPDVVDGLYECRWCGVRYWQSGDGQVRIYMGWRDEQP